MRKKIFIALFCLLPPVVQGQIYFPPNNSNEWDTIPPESLGWCQYKIDSLYQFLHEKNTKAFLILKDGKIALEKYFDEHTASSNWYWASAGKSLTAFLVGLAQQEGYLNLADTASTYLGKGWTSCTEEQEEKITVRHQLTMTTGLDDGVADPHCTDVSCLQYKTEPGTRWAYHNGPYTLLSSVLQKATGKAPNVFISQKLKNITGIEGMYINQDYNKVFFSTARSMARYGLLVLNKGNWNGTQIMTDTSYFYDMVNTSQTLNESYGYLWWLNGKNSFMIPQTQLEFQGSFCPNAPADMFAALGKNGQFINVVPSQNLVLIRMGDSPDNSLVPFLLNDEIWAYLNELTCETVSIPENNSMQPEFYTNSLKGKLFCRNVESFEGYIISLYNMHGRLLVKKKLTAQINLNGFSAGVYFLHISNGKEYHTRKIVLR